MFTSPQFGTIRTIGDADNPLFCLTDVCKSLGLRVKHVVPRLDDGVVSNDLIYDSLGRRQMAKFVNEDGLYDVIFDSRKPEAKAFRKWVTSVVLPSIRKTGGYGNVVSASFVEDSARLIVSKMFKFIDAILDESISQAEFKKKAPKQYYLYEIAKELGTTSENLRRLLVSIKLITASGYYIFPRSAEKADYFGHFTPCLKTLPQGIIVTEEGRREILSAWPTYKKQHPNL